MIRHVVGQVKLNGGAVVGCDVVGVLAAIHGRMAKDTCTHIHLQQKQKNERWYVRTKPSRFANGPVECRLSRLTEIKQVGVGVGSNVG